MLARTATRTRRLRRDRKKWPSASDPRAPYPTIDEICATGAYFLPQDRKLVRRHVESVDLQDERHGRRRLTIDLALPRDPEAAIAASENGYRFYIPIALMQKSPPTTNIDLVDEAEQSIPLLTRRQNARLTYAATLDMAEEVLGGTLSNELRRAIQQLIEQDGLAAELAFEYALVVIEEEHPGRLGTPRTATLETVLADFSVNSLLWVGLTGRPGARTIVKLSYEMPVELPPIPRRRPSMKKVSVVTPNAIHDFEYEDLGDGHEGSTVRRIWRRITHTLGWSPIALSIDSPYVRSCNSYHMQVQAPAGLEARSIRFAGGPEDAPAADEMQNPCSRGTAHLYLAGARTDQIAPPIIVKLGAGRRGFLSLALLSAAITSGLLWAFHARASDVSQHGIAAAVLLLVPGLLTAFAVRTQEHVLTARVLSGVRFLLLVAALISTAAAAAMSHVRPTDWSLSHTWYVYAILVSCVAGLLALSWLFSFRAVWRAGDWIGERLSSRRPLVALTFLLLLAAAGPALVGIEDSEVALAHRGAFLFGYGALIVVTGILTGLAEPIVPLRLGLAPLVLSLTVLLFLGQFLALLGVHFVPWTWHTTAEVSFFAAAGLGAALLTSEAWVAFLGGRSARA
jgi:hypothetical protein